MNPHAGDKELSDLLDFSAVSISWKISDTLSSIRNYTCDVAISERWCLQFINDRVCFVCWQFFFAQMFSPPGSMVGSKSSGSLTEAGLSSSMHASRTGAVWVLFVCRSP